MQLIKYIWPIWLFLAFQMPWNIVATFFHGQPRGQSAFGDWLYSRNCNWSLECSGGRLLWWVWLALGLLFVGNIAFQIYRNGGRPSHD